MPRKPRICDAIAAILCAGCILSAGFVTRIGHAQPAATRAEPAGVPVEAPGFVGKTALLDASTYTVGRRIFTPGARNANWHMHTAGQLVFAEAGRGRLQIKGQPVRELSAGDSAYIPPGVMHWHGAAPDESFTMTFINMGASTTSQGEALTDVPSR